METLKKAKHIYVTSPLLPDIEDVISELKKIYRTKSLTNMGEQHNMLEHLLKDILKVKNVSLFNNGTIALLTALKAFNFPINGEIITTPFTFAATPHCISWNGLIPVFCDITPDTMCIDADKIESLVTSRTRAILGVHIYGIPCDVEKIDQIAKKYNLKVIYDAAHVFSTELNGKGIGVFGDISMFSFHATKLFNTFEGGCLTYSDDNLIKKIYNLRNFGIRGEESVEEVGINGKMNELQAAIGILNLKLFEQEKEKRNRVASLYYARLSQVTGIRMPEMPDNATQAYQYFPIIIEEDYKKSRNELYLELKKYNIHTRKYFYPICSDYDCYMHLPSSDPKNLPVANDIKNRVLCLPFYGDLEKDVIDFICEVIIN